MNDADLFLRFSVATAVAAGVGVCGVGMLVFAPRGWLGRAVVAAVGLATMSGLSWALCPQYLGGLAGGGGAVAAVAVLLGVASVRRFVGVCLKPLARRRVAGAAAVVAAGGLWAFEAWQFDRGTQQQMSETLAAADAAPVNTTDALPAATDRGTPLPLLAPASPLPPSEMAALEASTSVVTSHLGQFIRRGPASDDSNCHGWVFTGGRFHVAGRYVPTILTDNGYTPVTAPAAGDLCVYRDPIGDVSHSAVVRAVLADGTVLVESKWGRMGVYLHEVNESAYGTDFTYYHSPRAGHLLHGLESETVGASSTQP